MAIAVVGAVVAGSAAWEGVANYGETWREKRRATESLKVEGWQFLQLCGKYQPDKEYKVAFPRFAAEVESMIAREVGEYLAVFDPSLAQIKKAAEDIINTKLSSRRKKRELVNRRVPQIGSGRPNPAVQRTRHKRRAAQRER